MINEVPAGPSGKSIVLDVWVRRTLRVRTLPQRKAWYLVFTQRRVEGRRPRSFEFKNF